MTQKFVERRQPGRMKADPISQFRDWLQEAEQSKVPEPEAMTLATAGRKGRPSARIVLLRGVDDRGFVFFTNYESRKAQELKANPAAALVFSWPPLARQVRIEGRIEPLEEGASDAYFAIRPRSHQLSAHASPQSQVIPNREFLDQRFVESTRRFAGQEVPRPRYWGGFRLVPDLLEFWEEGEHRLHDRLRYRRKPGGDWVIERLAP